MRPTCACKDQWSFVFLLDVDIINIGQCFVKLHRTYFKTKRMSNDDILKISDLECGYDKLISDFTLKNTEYIWIQ